MDINDTLFQSLLRKHNITSFHPFRIAENKIWNSISGGLVNINDSYLPLSNLYAYIKDSIFHVCDKNFTDIELSGFKFKESGLLQIGETDEYFVYPFDNCKNSIVINTDGKIILFNPENYFSVGKNEYMLDKPVFLNDFGDGIVYNVKRKEFMPPTRVLPSCSKRPDVKFPIIESKPLYRNGEAVDNLHYLFSVKTGNDLDETTSFFLDEKNDTVTVFESEYHAYNYELTPVCLWYTGTNVISISLKLHNKYDTDDNVLPLDEEFYKQSEYLNLDEFTLTLFELTVHSKRFTYKKFYGIKWPLRNKSGVSYFFENLNIEATKYTLLVYSTDNGYQIAPIIVRDNGAITFCDSIDGRYIGLSQNNLIIRDSSAKAKYTDFCDIFGNKLCCAPNEYADYWIFQRSIKVPTRFNQLEIEYQRQNIRNKFFDDQIFDVYEGVIDLKSGNVIIPPCFSKIELIRLSSSDINCNSHEDHVSIVQIDNYLNGVLRSYYGFYLNDTLVLPICYSKIEFLKYKYNPEKNRLFPADYDYRTIIKKAVSDYIIIQQNDLLGLATTRGKIIIEPCAESIILLEKVDLFTVRQTNGQDYYQIRITPQLYSREYVGMLKDGKYNLIYGCTPVYDFIFSDLEIVSLPHHFEEQVFVKVYKSNEVGLVHKGQIITKFYRDIDVYYSHFSYIDSTFDSYDDFVIVATTKSGNYGLLNKMGEIIIEFGTISIRPYENYIIYGTKFLDKNNKEIFNCDGYMLIDEKSGDENEHIFLYSKENEYVVIDNYGDLYDLDQLTNSKKLVFSVGNEVYSFDSVNKQFKESYYDDGYYGDDSDDNDDDIERDTYYALGGDDYDQFKSKGGNIDDMMDYLGY